MSARNAEKNCFENEAELLVIEDQIEWVGTSQILCLCDRNCNLCKQELIKLHLDRIKNRYPGNAVDGFFIGLRYHEDNHNWKWVRPGGMRTMY